MSAVKPENGKYYLIKNVDAKVYADMSQGLATDKNPIVGFQNLPYNDNRKWMYIDKGSDEFELQNAASKTYAAHTSEDSELKYGSEIYGHSTAKVFRLIDTKNNGYKIRAKAKDFSWCLSDNKDGTQITLIDDDDDDPTFGLVWNFIEIDLYAVKPKNGKYYLIKSVDAKLYADMSQGLATDKNPIVGFQNLPYNDNRKWMYIDKGSDEFELQNAASKTYAAHTSEDSELNYGSDIYGHSTAKVFRLIDTKNNAYKIRVKAKDLSWCLSDDKDGTQITLFDDYDDDPSFGLVWNFIEIDLYAGAKPENGKYYLIKNVDAKLYADMSQGLATDKNPIVGFQNLPYNDNRKWKYIDKGSDEFELQNAASKTYAAHTSEDSELKYGSEIYGHSTAKVFRLIDTGKNGYKIRVKAKDLSWCLSDDKDGTQITLIDDDDDDPTFGLVWNFIEIDS